MNLYVVDIDRGRLVLRETVVKKETERFYYIDAPGDSRYACGFSTRVEKHRFALSPPDAVARYIANRTRARETAIAVAEQATQQIAEAESLLLTLAGVVA